MVNPHSINRAVLMDDIKYEAMTEEHLQALRSMITSVVKGESMEELLKKFFFRQTAR